MKFETCQGLLPTNANREKLERGDGDHATSCHCLELDKRASGRERIEQDNSTDSEIPSLRKDDSSDADEYDFSLLKHVSPGMSRSSNEGEALDRFLKRFVPCMGIFMDASFFTNLILPATQTNDQVFNAALAVTTFHDLPMNDIWSDMGGSTCNKYQNALKWYRTSLKQSMESPPDNASPQSIAVSLLTITLYLGIELRQLNWSAQEGLVQAAYSIIHSARSSIKSSRNMAILLCLSMIMDFTCINAINPSSIPRDHWESASYLAQRLWEDCNATENLIVRFELYRIMYDVNCILDRGEGSDFELECRMQRWLAHLKRYEASLPLDFKARIPVLRCRFLFSQLQVAWETYLYGVNVNKEEIRARLSNVLMIHEVNENNTKKVKNRPSWYLDTAIVPSCLWVAWYWRSGIVLARIRKIFKGYQDENQLEQVRFVKIVLRFLTTLVHTPYNKATKVEQELFGKRPRVLQNYHSYRYLDYLIRTNKPGPS